ncbi:MAG: hypothetical protein ACYC91_13615 [Solirubrobacteraceae bacterium]
MMDEWQSSRHCVDCGVALEPSAAHGDAKACVACGGASTPSSIEALSGGTPCEHCGRPIASIGAHCPWCGGEVRSAFEAAVAAGTLRRAPFEPRWPFSPWHGAGAGGDAPLCPDCGDPVRSAEAPRETRFPGCCNPPWNAGWDGCCEACGARFELVVHTPLHFNVERTTTVRPASKPYRTFVDEGFVLSGVELTVTERSFTIGGVRCPPDEPSTTQTLFLSMAEVVSLAQALDDNLRLYLGLSSRSGGELSVREVDPDAGAAEVDHRDQGVGGVESVGAV